MYATTKYIHLVLILILIISCKNNTPKLAEEKILRPSDLFDVRFKAWVKSYRPYTQENNYLYILTIDSKTKKRVDNIFGYIAMMKTDGKLLKLKAVNTGDIMSEGRIDLSSGFHYSKSTIEVLETQGYIIGFAIQRIRFSDSTVMERPDI